MRISRFCLFIFTITFLGCQNKPEPNLLTFRAIDRSIVISNTFIADQNNHVFELIKKKSNELTMSGETLEWETKAGQVKKFSTETNDYINGLKISLKQEAGFTMINDREFFKEDDIEAVHTLFEKKGKAAELKKYIEKYENEILAIDSSINATFKNTINFSIRLSDLNKDYKKPFYETFFDGNSVILTMTVLSNFQNNINIFENEVLNFCYDKIQSKS